MMMITNWVFQFIWVAYLKHAESWSHYIEINFARHNHDTDV